MHALARVTPYMTVLKGRVHMNAFFTSQLSYCPLVWISHNITLNNKINRFHKMCLRIVLNDKHSTFKICQIRTDLFQCTLVIWKHLLQKCIKIFTDNFSSNFRANYDLRYRSEFSRLLVQSVFNGTEVISYLRPRIWDPVHLEIKQVSLAALKRPLRLGTNIIIQVDKLFKL